MSTTSLSNTPQAQDDLFTSEITGLTDGNLKIVTLGVMTNDLGGNARSLYSIDNGTNSLQDLLTQDTARTEDLSTDHSANGAHIWITSDGGVGYDGSTLNSGFKSQLLQVAPGHFLYDTFTYAIRLGNGTLSWATATVQIEGSNHPALIGDPAVHDVTEDVNISPNGNLTASDTLAISDLDPGQDSFQTNVIPAAGNLGTLTLASNGAYTYSVANSATQYLGGNDTRVETFTVTSFDGTTKQVSFTIHGTNDAAAIGTPTVHDVTEDVAPDNSGNLTASGTLSISDADLGQASFQTGVTATGNLGALTLASNGDYTYSVANSLTQYLSATDTRTDTFTVKSLDGTTKQVSFAIHGAQDAPNLVLGATTATGASDKDIALSVGANLVDTSSTLTVEIDGVPSFYSLNHGTALDDGRWLVSAADLSTLALVPNGATACNFNLHVTAISDDGVHQASSPGQDIAVTVSPGANELGGRIVDGYIAGATVFADANNNGVLDLGEAHTTTNADGSFTLIGGSGPLVSMGGTDVSTGLAFNGVLRAPAGSTVITPLTTLIAALVPNNANQSQIDAASDQVAAALGLDTNINLQTFDPVPGVIAGNNPAATAVLSAAIQVESTVVQLSAAVGGANPSPATSAGVFAAIANAITAAQADPNDSLTFDLTTSSTVTSIATDPHVNVSATEVTAVTQIVSAANTVIDTSTTATTLAQAAEVAQGVTTTALAGSTDPNTLRDHLFDDGYSDAREQCHGRRCQRRPTRHAR
jgi:VCBS repeat-containing protein